MRHPLPHRPARWLALLSCAVAVMGQLSTAQEPVSHDFSRLFAGLPASSQPMAVAASFELAKEGRAGVLLIAGRVEEGWHSNSLGQSGGPGPLKITPTPSPDFEITGAFQASTEPKAKTYPDIWPGIEVNEHDGDVVWFAPILLAEGTAPEDLTIEVKFNAIVCSDTCIPLRKTLSATFGGRVDNLPVQAVAANSQPETAAPPVHADPSTNPSTNPATAPAADEVPEVLCEEPAFSVGHADVTGELSAGEVAPGGKVLLRFKTTVDAGYHVYRYFQTPPEFSSNAPTRFRLKPSPAWKMAAVSTSAPWEANLHDRQALAFYPGDVEFVIELEVPADTAPGSLLLEGVIGMQTCDSNGCDPPAAARFQVPLKIAESPSEGGPVQALFGEGNYYKLDETFASWPAPAEAEKPVSGKAGSETAAATGPSRLNLDDIRPETTTPEYSIPLIALIALGGGFILNFMPCVLPVIGLKIFSFLQQAGQDRWKAVALNLWYTLGILTVFMILGTLAAFFSFSWGQQSQSEAFQITLAAIVFVMGLSFLGVWEIPLPGFVGRSALAKGAEGEGAPAAFLKGILTTIMAVPCSGPLLSTALGWCSDKPPVMIYMVFLFLGLGMALPYVLIGFFPGLVRALPKPGMWMDTLKQFLGFVLLGTVVYLIWTVPSKLWLSSFAFMFVLWFACWLYGRLPAGSSPRKVFATVLATTVVAVAGFYGSFMFLGKAADNKFVREVDRFVSANRNRVNEMAAATGGVVKANDTAAQLEWQPYSLARLQAEVDQNKTVIVDFTADWCLTCQTLKKYVLDTARVQDAVSQNGVVLLLADWTEPDDDIEMMLDKLVGTPSQIPVLAIYPADNPNRPIVLTGIYSQDMVLQELGKAGPSKQTALQEAETTGVRVAVVGPDEGS